MKKQELIKYILLTMVFVWVSLIFASPLWGIACLIAKHVLFDRLFASGKQMDVGQIRGSAPTK